MDERMYGKIRALEDEHWWFRGRRAVIRALTRRLGAGSPRILDAGCGTGRNLEDYALLGPAEGVDPSPLAVRFCQDRGLKGVRESGLERLPYEEGRFELLFASDVLEHIEDDDGALRELARVTAPAGHLVITVPAYGWLWSEHDDAHQHFRRYTRPALVERVRTAGWTVERATYFNTTLLAPIAAVRATERFRGRRGGDDYAITPKRVNAALEGIMRAEAALIAAGRSLPAGVSIGLVCRRADGA